MKKTIIYLISIVMLSSVISCKDDKQVLQTLKESETLSVPETQVDNLQAAESAQETPDEIDIVLANKQVAIEYVQLMGKTKTIRAKTKIQTLKNSKTINFSDENKQVEQDISAIKAVSLTNQDLKKLQALAIQVLQRYKALNEALMNSHFDKIKSIDKSFKQAVNEFDSFDKEVITKYKIGNLTY